VNICYEVATEPAFARSAHRAGDGTHHAPRVGLNIWALLGPTPCACFAQPRGLTQDEEDPMNGEGVRVLIVGAGIAGLAAARTLRGWGAAVEIIERASSPATEGAGIYLPGNAMRALDDLGVGAQVARGAVVIGHQRVLDHSGRLLFDVDVSEVWDGVGACVALPRTALHAVLLAGAGSSSIKWATTIKAIHEDHEGVAVEFDDGTIDRYDLVLGADGLHSTVRRLVVDAAPPRPVGQFARRFVIPHPDSEPVWSAMLGPKTSFLTIPIGGGRIYCYTDGPAVSPQPSLHETLANYAPPAPELLAALGDARAGNGNVQAGPIEEVVLGSWSRGAVLLIGDAAHATSPNMAQGAAMALEDALVLADCLESSATIAEAIGAFERRRRARTDWVLHQTHRRDRTRTLPGVVRDLVLRQFGPQIFRANYRPLRALA
jgi:2-polyprenyl-6-methoxyphenol hydroxylase-like FAD-dependent oxidoreductase